MRANIGLGYRSESMPQFVGPTRYFQTDPFTVVEEDRCKNPTYLSTVQLSDWCNLESCEWWQGTVLHLTQGHQQSRNPRLYDRRHQCYSVPHDCTERWHRMTNTTKIKKMKAESRPTDIVKYHSIQMSAKRLVTLQHTAVHKVTRTFLLHSRVLFNQVLTLLTYYTLTKLRPH
jgi:hypothetical protein